MRKILLIDLLRLPLCLPPERGLFDPVYMWPAVRGGWLVGGGVLVYSGALCDWRLGACLSSCVGPGEWGA